MSNRIPLYVFLVLALGFQAFAKNPWIPDLVLVSVVFAGIIGGGLEGIVLGLVAGLFRGCFSGDTIYLDIILFPTAGFLSSVLAGKLFRRNPFVQMAVTSTMMFLLIGVHISLLSFMTGSGLSVFSGFLRSWRVVLSTTLAAPVFFGILSFFCRGPE